MAAWWSWAAEEVAKSNMGGRCGRQRNFGAKPGRDQIGGLHVILGIVELQLAIAWTQALSRLAVFIFACFLVFAESVSY